MFYEVVSIVGLLLLTINSFFSIATVGKINELIEIFHVKVGEKGGEEEKEGEEEELREYIMKTLYI